MSRGLDSLSRRWRTPVLVALAVALTVVEVVLSIDVFRSRYNWLHLGQSLEQLLRVTPLW